ncbi:MAG: SDR family oxidoreductase [bacterium]|nr:SDR family oxidoreductase [bacterium]
MHKDTTVLITGTRKGIGKYLVEHYINKGFRVIGCSRNKADYEFEKYKHYCLDISDETSVKNMFMEINKKYNRLDILINNAGVASMNHSLLTPLKTAHKIIDTNLIGTFLFCREAARLMQRNKFGRIINFVTVAVPLKLAGEAIYSASKAAVLNLTQIMAKELGDMNITVNAIGPTPVKTDLIRSIPKPKIDNLINSQSIRRFGTFEDISNITDFFIKSESDFITGQVLYLGGVT